MRHDAKTTIITRFAAALLGLLVAAACDAPVTPLEGPTTPPVADDGEVLVQFAEAAAQLADGEELRSRRGKPYTANGGRDRVHDFGGSYYGLTTGVSVEGTHDAGEEDVECDGSGAGFTSCVKVQMDIARECRTRAREDGDAYHAYCEEWRN